MLATVTAFSFFAGERPAAALPSFAQQTGQPCSQCHVGSYGPQLKQYGRDFKLYGYVSGDKANRYPPISALLVESYTHTQADRAKPLTHFDNNDNVAAVDKAKLAYAGALPGNAGAFAEITYDGVKEAFTIDNIDIRKAINPLIGTNDVVLGVDLNNRPTVQDPWNSTPTFAFVTNTSPLASTPASFAVVDGKLAQRVVGFGAYAMWNSLLYAEFTAYDPVENNTLNRMGVHSTANTDAYDGAIPYWRLALQRDFADRHYVQVGTYGLEAERFPSGNRSHGKDRFTDVAVDANYQFTGSAKHYVSAHATYIHETDELDASHLIFKTKSKDYLNTTRADVSYSYGNSWTPTVEVFRIKGSTDAPFFKTPNGSPNSEGYVAELAYVPFGVKDSPVLWANGRFALRWVGYSKFNGTSKGASGNNTIYISARYAVAPFGALVKR